MKRALKVVAAFALLAVTQSALAQGWPSKPLRVVVTFPPGGSNDIVARLVGERLRTSLGQPVVIDNRPGVAGILGTEMVVKSAPNGYTLLVTSVAPIAFAPSTPQPLSYNPVKHLQHVAVLATSPLAYIVNTALPAKNVTDVVAIAKNKPGMLNFSSSGNATTSHLMLERFKLSAGVQITHVPYKGSAPALIDIMANRIDGTIDSLPALLAHIRASKVKALAVTGAERTPQLPDVPTLAESGFPDLVVTTWVGIAVPAGTPAEVVQRLNKELLAAVQIPEVKARFDELSFAPARMSVAETHSFMQAEIERWRPVVRAAGITFQ